MRKNIWIFNHYSTNMFFEKGGRHYWFAENLIVKGYNPTIFCSSTNHNSDKHINTKGNSYSTENSNNIPFVFIKTSTYKKNDKRRILNMLSFYRGLLKVSKKYAKLKGKPDIIIASSVHPLTLLAGIKIAKKMGVPCICEVRDLWPESLVAYGFLKHNSLIAKLLYQYEKRIYIKADFIIMTWAGGIQYIIDQGWDNKVDLNKIKHISNGVMIGDFDRNIQKNKIIDEDLDNKDYKNLIYTGSIRKVNNLGLLIEAAKILQKYDLTIRFLIYGSGDEKEMLEQRIIKEGISNVIFKDRVTKSMVPSILTRGYANILHNSSTTLDRYGQSQNKFFEYLAAGKCIIQTYTTGYSILERNKCGVSISAQTPEKIAEAIHEVCIDEKNIVLMGHNARVLSYEFDFEKLTNQLISVIESV